MQLLASVAVTRAFGVRVPVRALLAGAAIHGLTHAVLDRREPLLWLVARAGVPAGEWTGRGAPLLGLSGEVTEAEMELPFG